MALEVILHHLIPKHFPGGSMPPDFSSYRVYTILKYLPPPLGVDTEISYSVYTTVTSFPVRRLRGNGKSYPDIISTLPAGKVGFLWSSNELL